VLAPDRRGAVLQQRDREVAHERVARVVPLLINRTEELVGLGGGAVLEVAEGREELLGARRRK